MKIIRLSNFLDYGGIESKMEKLATVNDENQWVFTAIGKGGHAEKKIKDLNKECHCLNLNVKIPTVKTIIKLTEYFIKQNPDIIHASGAEANFYAYVCGKRAKAPKIICEEIGDFNHGKLAKIVFKFIFKNCDYVLGESNFVVDKIKKVYSIPNDKAKVVPNFGLFNYDFSNLKKNNTEKFRILMVSRLEAVKNIEDVIKVVSTIKCEYPHVELNIIGSGTLKNELKILINNLNAHNYVNLLGYKGNPYPYYYESDLYILNSFSEGFSNSLIESMNAETPSLSTCTGSAPDIISDNVNGFLIPTNDPEALENKIKYILSIPKNNLLNIGKKGKETIKSKYSIENHLEKLYEIYK